MGQQFPPRRILVVDDNHDATESVADLLSALGQTAMTAFGGEECRASFPGFDPDLILMDINMPDMDGYETASAVRRQCKRRPRIVALTSWTGENVRPRLAEAGFDSHLRKPASIEDLQREIEASAPSGR